LLMKPLAVLESRLFDDNVAVSYKWLSMDQGLSTLEAKDLLNQFYAQHGDRVSAVFLVSGRSKETSGLHVVRLVPANQLNEARSQFDPVLCEEIYSLAPLHLKVAPLSADLPIFDEDEDEVNINEFRSSIVDLGAVLYVVDAHRQRDMQALRDQEIDRARAQLRRSSLPPATQLILRKGELQSRTFGDLSLVQSQGADILLERRDSGPIQPEIKEPNPTASNSLKRKESHTSAEEGNTSSSLPASAASSSSIRVATTPVVALQSTKAKSKVNAPIRAFFSNSGSNALPELKHPNVSPTVAPTPSLEAASVESKPSVLSSGASSVVHMTSATLSSSSPARSISKASALLSYIATDEDDFESVPRRTVVSARTSEKRSSERMQSDRGTSPTPSDAQDNDPCNQKLLIAPSDDSDFEDAASSPTQKSKSNGVSKFLVKEKPQDRDAVSSAVADADGLITVMQSKSQKTLKTTMDERGYLGTR